jgi:hypothetical protein
MNRIGDKLMSTDHALEICASYVDVLRWQLQSRKSISKRAGAEPVGRIGHAACTARLSKVEIT